LSNDAFQETATLVVVDPVTISPVGVVGACVSGQAAVDALTVEGADLLPAASKASTPSV
jgi:hypothetical protein